MSPQFQTGAALIDLTGRGRGVYYGCYESYGPYNYGMRSAPVPRGEGCSAIGVRCGCPATAPAASLRRIVTLRPLCCREARHGEA